jgi:hypothetical protein
MDKEYSLDNMDEHYLVIIDNMVSHRVTAVQQILTDQMNLDMMYEATKYTGDPLYADIANSQAEKSSDTHVRPDGTTYHVVNMDQKTGKGFEFMTAQGNLSALHTGERQLTFQAMRTNHVGLADRHGQCTGMRSVVRRLWRLAGLADGGSSPNGTSGFHRHLPHSRRRLLVAPARVGRAMVVSHSARPWLNS